MEIIIKTFHGLEEVLAQELRDMGIDNPDVLTRAVRCQGDKALLYRLNYELRTALRILVPIHKWKALNYTDIYEETKRIPWGDYLTSSQSFAIKCNSFSKFFKNTQFALQRVKDGIVDAFRNDHGARPSVDKENPDLWLNLHIYENEVQLLWDSSGEPLFKRGYGKQRGIAPINEVLAAGIIAMSSWDPSQNFYDPMCGSGTFLLEAISMASQTPSQAYREHWHFMNRRDYDRRLWKDVVASAKKKSAPEATRFYASDIDSDAIYNTSINVKNSPIDASPHLWTADFFKIYMGAKPGWVFMNPPYNERLTLDQSIGWHMKVGKVLRERYGGWNICIMSGDQEALKHLGLKANKKIELYNGAIPIMVYFIDIFDR